MNRINVPLNHIHFTRDRIVVKRQKGFNGSFTNLTTVWINAHSEQQKQQQCFNTLKHTTHIYLS